MIFVVEDNALLQTSMVEFLSAKGHESRGFGDAEGAIEAARTSPPDVVISDLQLPGKDGIELITHFAKIDPSIVRIVVTGESSSTHAERAIAAGCYEYLEKPVDLNKLVRLVDRALGDRRARLELSWLRKQGERRDQHDPILGQSSAMHALRRQITALADLKTNPPPVLITGETGVGKGLVARAIHERRFGNHAPRIDVNCAGIPDSLIEAELFGYERSAFTDAKQAKPGLFEAAAGGTIFLDEIGEMGVHVQSKLLHAVESSSVRRLGAVRDRSISAAIVAASNSNLQAAIKEGRFRADLFHRLAAFTIHVPPLRERDGDAVLLAEAFLCEAAQRYGKTLHGLHERAAERIRRWSWPGNVRELRFAIEHATILSPEDADVLRAEYLPLGADTQQVHGSPGDAQGAVLRLDAREPTIEVHLPENGVDFEDIERAVIGAALRQTGGNLGKAAQLLRLTRDTIRYRVQKLGIPRQRNSDG